MQSEKPQLDTAADLARFLNVSLSYIRRLTRKPNFPHFKVGHAVRYDRQAVLTWIKERTQSTL